MNAQKQHRTTSEEGFRRDATMTETIKVKCLIEELDIAKSLLMRGFGELQEIRMGNDCYHLPQQLLASGLERLMKCYFCLVFEAKNGHFPDPQFLKDLGHDLDRLLQILRDDYYNDGNRPLLRDDQSFLRDDKHLHTIIHILSEFGKKARYYNLDVVTGNKKQAIDPKEEWERLERELLDPIPYPAADSMEARHRDYYPRVNAAIISKLERLLRAVAMQFTLGNHGGRLLQMSSILTPFLTLRDHEFGTTDYRPTVEKTKASWVKRSREEVMNGKWPTRVVSRAQDDKDWPFRFDEVILECRDTFFCIINIEDYDFALNGAASSRFNLPFPHDAGVAILGKSVGPFIEMAHDLSNRNRTGGRS